MLKKIEWSWEKLDEATCRAKVMKGWLVCHCSNDGKRNTTEAMVFVSDPEHQWVIVAPFDPSAPGTVKSKVNPADFESKL